jgi:hypothetical protein
LGDGGDGLIKLNADLAAQDDISLVAGIALGKNLVAGAVEFLNEEASPKPENMDKGRKRLMMARPIFWSWKLWSIIWTVLLAWAVKSPFSRE